jgi:hypothetical protein
LYVFKEAARQWRARFFEAKTTDESNFSREWILTNRGCCEIRPFGAIQIELLKRKLARNPTRIDSKTLA